MVENIESLKKGAFGDGVTTCVICGSQTTSLRIFTVKCYICDKLVCESCAVHSEFSAGNQRKQVRLCRICNEIREALRCSGAWLFKEIPQKLSALLPYYKLCSAGERKMAAAETLCNDNGAEQNSVNSDTSATATSTLERTASPEQAPAPIHCNSNSNSNNHERSNVTSFVSSLSLSGTHANWQLRSPVSMAEPPIVCLPSPVAPKFDAQLYINEELARIQAQHHEKSKKHHRKVSVAIVAPAIESTNALAFLATPTPRALGTRRVSLSQLNNGDLDVATNGNAKPRCNLPHRKSFNEFERSRPQITPRPTGNSLDPADSDRQRRPSFVAAISHLMDKDKSKEKEKDKETKVANDRSRDNRRLTTPNLDDSAKTYSLTLPVPPAAAWLTPAETRRTPSGAGSGAKVSPTGIRRAHSNKFPIGDMVQPVLRRRDTPASDD